MSSIIFKNKAVLVSFEDEFTYINLSSLFIVDKFLILIQKKSFLYQNDHKVFYYPCLIFFHVTFTNNAKAVIGKKIAIYIGNISI